MSPHRRLRRLITPHHRPGRQQLARVSRQALWCCPHHGKHLGKLNATSSIAPLLHWWRRSSSGGRREYRFNPFVQWKMQRARTSRHARAELQYASCARVWRIAVDLLSNCLPILSQLHLAEDAALCVSPLWGASGRLRDPPNGVPSPPPLELSALGLSRLVLTLSPPTLAGTSMRTAARRSGIGATRIAPAVMAAAVFAASAPPAGLDGRSGAMYHTRARTRTDA